MPHDNPRILVFSDFSDGENLRKIQTGSPQQKRQIQVG